MSNTNLSMKDMFGKMPETQSAALERAELVAALKKELSAKSTLIQWSVVRGILFDKTVAMLDIPLVSFLAPAWKKYREIMEFADARKYPPDETELVSLAEHTIAIKHHPYLKVTYRGKPLPNAKLTFTLQAELTLRGVILNIRDGRIVVIQAGSVSGSGELLFEDRSIIKKEFPTCTLAGSIDLGSGINLRAAEDQSAAAKSA